MIKLFFTLRITFRLVGMDEGFEETNFKVWMRKNQKSNNDKYSLTKTNIP